MSAPPDLLPRKSPQQQIGPPGALVAALAVLPLLGWWLYGLFDLDEGFYAAVVAEMNRRGEWITPYFNGHPWFEKPILLYWLAKPSIALLGNDIGPRLPSVLATLATYGVVAWFARRNLGPQQAARAVLILASSLLVVGVGRMMLTDPLLVLALTLAFTTYWESIVGDWKWRLLTAASLGLAVLAKGPVAILLFAPVAAYTWWRFPKGFFYPEPFAPTPDPSAHTRSTKPSSDAFQPRSGDPSPSGGGQGGGPNSNTSLPQLGIPSPSGGGQGGGQNSNTSLPQLGIPSPSGGGHGGGPKSATSLPPSSKSPKWGIWLLGAGIFLAVVATWYVPAYIANGHLFVQKFLIEQNVGRFTGGDAAHTVTGVLGLLFYVLIVLIGMAPWSIQIPDAWRFARSSPLSSYLKAWALTVFVFFTISGAKLPHYILPAFPALVLLIADSMALTGRSWRPLIVWTICMTFIANLGFLAWYSASGQAEVHAMARYVASHAKPTDLVAEFQFGRRASAKGTMRPKIQETSEPSTLLYLDRVVLDSDNWQTLLNEPAPVWILTRPDRIGLRETQLAGNRLTRVDTGKPSENYVLYELLPAPVPQPAQSSTKAVSP